MVSLGALGQLPSLQIQAMRASLNGARHDLNKPLLFLVPFSDICFGGLGNTLKKQFHKAFGAVALLAHRRIASEATRVTFIPKISEEMPISFAISFPFQPSLWSVSL